MEQNKTFQDIISRCIIARSAFISASIIAIVSFTWLTCFAADSIVYGSKEPLVEARIKKIFATEDQNFRDLNGNGTLDAYEDWRLRLPTNANLPNHDSPTTHTSHSSEQLYCYSEIGWIALKVLCEYIRGWGHGF